MDFFLTYDDAVDIVSDHLSSLENIKEFCKAHKLCYINVLGIRAKRNKTRYPKLVQKILVLMGNTVEIETCFIIKKENILKK